MIWLKNMITSKNNCFYEFRIEHVVLLMKNND